MIKFRILYERIRVIGKWSSLEIELSIIINLVEKKKVKGSYNSKQNKLILKKKRKKALAIRGYLVE